MSRVSALVHALFVLHGLAKKKKKKRKKKSKKKKKNPPIKKKKTNPLKINIC